MIVSTEAQPGQPRHVAVVGGGIAGLAAAYFLRRTASQTGGRLGVTVFEESPDVGGKLRVSDVAGVPVDEAADAILARRSEGEDLVRAVGLGDELVPASPARGGVWTRGALRPLPQGQIMGVPGDLGALARSQVLSAPGLARAPLDLVLPPTPVGDDVAVGPYVASRLGVEVVDRLVDPLLGGVYAGHAGMLSLQATVPRLAEVARGQCSLLKGVRGLCAAAPPESGPAFTTLRGGLGTLPAAVARASGAEIRTESPVRGLRRSPRGWQLMVGSAREPERVDADAVVLAVPAGPGSRLLAREVPAAAADLESIDYASVVTVTLAYPRSAFPALPDGSGYLVPAVEGRSMKAATFMTTKWPHLAESAGGTVLVRCSLGRYGMEQALQRPDAELVATTMAELAEAAGVRELPLDTRVSRWGGALPQYSVGHTDRVARIREAAGRVPGLAVCGAAYDGLGVPACVASAEAAANQALRQGQ